MNTILWAINSKCNFNCKYCYLNFPIDENPISNVNNFEEKDVEEEKIIEFISRFKELDIGRVFIAGAEPLSYADKTFRIINKLKDSNVQVVLCTNGYTLEKHYKEIINTDIDAISISLDSFDKEYNDKYRQYPNSDGWQKVVDGIKQLVNEKNKKKANLKIGIYTVMTKQNIKHLKKTYEFLDDLEIDYYVFQPIYLNKNENLYDELVLDKNDVLYLKEIISDLYKNAKKTMLPNKNYINMMVKSIENDNIEIKDCFAGKNLFFITPDGRIHMCPSSKCIVNEQNIFNINDNLEDVFLNHKYRISECNAFSEDCVNMWQLMSFDEIIQKGGQKDGY